MKRILSILFCLIITLSFFSFDTRALTEDYFVPYVVDFVVTSDSNLVGLNAEDARTDGLIAAYSLALSKTGTTTLKITGVTYGVTGIIKSGFKDLTIQRRKSSNYAWKNYYEFGNVYVDAIGANLDTTLVVETGYEYRVACKHYAKKNILQTQTISNTSNIVTV